MYSVDTVLLNFQCGVRWYLTCSSHTMVKFISMAPTTFLMIIQVPNSLEIVVFGRSEQHQIDLLQNAIPEAADSKEGEGKPRAFRYATQIVRHGLFQVAKGSLDSLSDAKRWDMFLPLHFYCCDILEGKSTSGNEIGL